MTRTFVSSLFSVALLTACVEGGPPAARDASSLDASTSDGGGRCTTDEVCDDSMFCNGTERCVGGACTPGSAPCRASQLCEETAAACVTDCDANPDADGDGVDAVECGGADCDDSDERTYPGAPEVCDLEGHDEDCDPSTFGDRDLDADGEIDARCCNGDRCGTDCDDLRASVRSGGAELCNTDDDDCDGMIDERVRVEVWPDTDRDGHGDASAESTLGCPGVAGMAGAGDDCDDDARTVRPGHPELCDAIDNDCDGEVDEAPEAVTWYHDADGDGYGRADASATRVSCAPVPGYSTDASDCDDTDADVSPGAPERCNGRDDDCDGAADFVIASGDLEDDDGDGHADRACEGGDDCDDRDPFSSPSGFEICDRRDNDCDGSADEETATLSWYRDVDGDSYGSGAPTLSCEPIAGHTTRSGDCDESDASIRPGAIERCDSADDDCDGMADEGIPVAAYYLDRDRDGLGAGTPVLACAMPLGRVTSGSDCDDASATVGLPSAWSPDRDADGFGDLASPIVLACGAPARHVENRLDCDDDAPAINPTAVDACNGLDDDCDGAIDDGAEARCVLPNATASCVSAECAIGECRAGFGDCDAMTSTGCELPLLADPANCGMCGRACAAGESCRSGACTGIRALTAGGLHFCALLATGGVSCWGSNSYGQLGNGSGSGASTPQTVLLYTGEVLRDVIAISASAFGHHTCALRSGGDVVCWGRNDSSQCGAAAPPTATRAYPIAGVSGARAIDVGVSHSCALLTTGRVLCWGSNGNGRLGTGMLIPAVSGAPLPMVEFEGGATREIADAIDVEATSTSTCVVHAGGARVSCAGASANGRLGRGSIPSGDYPTADDVLLPAGTLVRDLRASSSTLCALVAGDTSPVCWGYGGDGALGPGRADQFTPVVLDTLLFARTTDVSVGTYFTCVAYDNPAFGARIACAGNDSLGSLGDGTSGGRDSTFDDVVTGADGSAFISSLGMLTSSDWTTCGIAPTGGVVCWGYNGNQELGYSTPSTRPWVDLSRPVPGVP